MNSLGVVKSATTTDHHAGGIGYGAGGIGHVAGGALTPAEKNKQWQRELLMERFRSHSIQQKSFPELSKSMRMSMLEKRYALDAVEKSNLQKCLDSMQHCIKVTSRQGLVERLESLSRQLGLKFMEDTSGLFISTDMFYLEIILDANGALTDVKVHHECKIEQQSCSELVNCLNRGDFADFTVQLEGLSSIYQLNAEPKIKTKAFVALQAMETDLFNLFQIQNFSKDTQAVIAESTVGIVLKRRGGHPMKLTYFVSPYDLLNIETKTMLPLTIDLIATENIGMSVTVNLEASSANKLQILPTVTFVKDQQGHSEVDIPIYSPLTQINSTLLPATFVLRLNKPLPVCYNTLRSLVPSVAVETVAVEQKASASLPLPTTSSISSPTNIMNLIIQTASENQMQNSSKGLFVCLPDQTHCYFFTENKQMKATLLLSVPFTEPSQVPKILKFLKSQSLFYTLLGSCVRPQTKMGDMDATTILEVNATSFQQISVALEHPYEESMATVEFNLSDTAVVCNIFSMSSGDYELLSTKLTNVVQKTLSIPVTIRSLLKHWDQEQVKMFQRATQAVSDFGNFSLAMGPNDPGGRGGGGGGGGGGKIGGVGVGGTSGGSIGISGSGGGSGGIMPIAKSDLSSLVVDRSSGASGVGVGCGSANNFASLNRQFFHAVPPGCADPEGFPELVGPPIGSGGVGGTATMMNINTASVGITPNVSINATSAAAAAAGILKQFKSEIKQEDFCKSPKSNQPTMQSASSELGHVDSSSLGKCTTQHQHQHHQKSAVNASSFTVGADSTSFGVALSSSSSSSSTSVSAAAFANTANQQQRQLQTTEVLTAGASSYTTVTAAPVATAETSSSATSQFLTDRNADIAEKYQKIWKDKTTLKNTVSITPIMSTVNMATSSVDTTVPVRPLQSGPSSLESKRPGIEIIPLTTTHSPQSTSNAAATSSSSITITPINTAGGCTGTTIVPASLAAAVSTCTSFSSSSASSKTDKKLLSNTSFPSTSSSSSSKRSGTDERGTEPSKSSEKKRRKKRDDSPMGPPEKLIFSRQNSPASDPITLTRKFSSPQLSPKSGLLGTAVLSSASSSPGIMSGGGTNVATGTAKPSPKHSPVYSSPKHTTPVPSGSPKSPFGTLSPKHGSSGKPSMSTLKSATAGSSTSPKHEKNSVASFSTTTGGPGASSSRSSSSNSSSSSKSRDKDNKDRTSSSMSTSSSSSKILQSANKSNTMKVSTSIAGSSSPLSSAVISPHSTSQQAVGFQGISEFTATTVGSAAVQTARKGGSSLSAVIDKLKLAQSPCDDDDVFSSSTTHALTNCQVSLAQPTVQPLLQHNLDSGCSSSSSSTHNSVTGSVSSEYMVKPSHDAMKIIINKTKAQSSGSSSGSIAAANSSATSAKSKSSLGTSSINSKISSPNNSASGASPGKKPHTGLKPGVNSGPASKKSSSSSLSPSYLTNSASGSSSSTSTPASGSKFSSSSNSSTKHIFQKSNSSGSLSTKVSATNSTSASGSSLTKSHSTSSFSSESYRSGKTSSGGGGSSSSSSLSGGTGTINKKSSSNFSFSEREKSSSSYQPSTLSSSASHHPTRSDPHADMMKILQFASPNMGLEGFMKTLNTKFQIPKLSARLNATSNASPDQTASPTSAAEKPRSTSAAVAANNSSHYQQQHHSNTSNDGATITNESQQTSKKFLPSGNKSAVSSDYYALQQNSSSSTLFPHTLSTGSHNSFNSGNHYSHHQQKQLLSSSFDAQNLNSMHPPAMDDSNSSNAKFFLKNSEKNHATNSKMPLSSSGGTGASASPNITITNAATPSLSVHILKSPVPSPLIGLPLSSPRSSVSPSTTTTVDDDSKSSQHQQQPQLMVFSREFNDYVSSSK